MGIAYIMLLSLHILNHESLSPLLRILTAAELYLYNGFYAEHSMFEEAYKKHIGEVHFLTLIVLSLQEYRIESWGLNI